MSYSRRNNRENDDPSIAMNSHRVRMVLDSAASTSSIGISSSSLSIYDDKELNSSRRYVKTGSFVVDEEHKDFDAAAIRNTTVPDVVGSQVPLDDESDDDIDSESKAEGYHHMDALSMDQGDNECWIEDEGKQNNGDKAHETEGVLFSKNDLENYDKYHRSSSGSRRKNIIYGMAVLFAVSLTGIVGVILGDKVMTSNKNLQSVGEMIPGEAAASGEEFWVDADLDEGVMQDWIEEDADNGTPEYSFVPPPPNNGDSPPELASLAPLSEIFSYEVDTPFLWVIPRTASLQARDAIGNCFHLKFSRLYKGEETDLVFSHLLYKVSNSFNAFPQRGRMFTILRDPMKRTMDMWQAHRAEENNIGLEDYLKFHHDNNWLTRFLTNNFDKPLTQESLETAKTILREKCIIGLDDKKEDSFNRFIHYFHWDTLSLDTQQCINIFLHAPNYVVDLKLPLEFSPGYQLLKTRNHMDIPLYEYAKQLYGEQGQKLFSDLVQN